MIRHGKTVNSWDILDHNQLVRLLRNESDPLIDFSFLLSRLDMERIRKMKYSVIYCAPSIRALQTASYIGKELGLPIKVVDDLKEVRFEDIPKSVYQAGTRAMRSYLVNKSLEAKFDYNRIKRLFRDNALILTHSFLMRLIFCKQFRVDMSTIVCDGRFTSYFAGFDCKTGKGVFLDRKNLYKYDNR